MRYVTGLPVSSESMSTLGRALFRFWINRYQIQLPSQFVDQQFIAPVVRNTLCRVLPRSIGTDVSHRAEGWFDQLVARKLLGIQADAVVGYENACLELFRTAKAHGMMTILDAASVHHQTQDQFFTPSESARVHQRIVRRKSEEIALADVVFTASDFARESYLAAGVSSGRVKTIPVGVDLDLFAPRITRGAPKDNLRFVFVGNASPHKACDLLADAFQRLVTLHPDAHLSVIGGAHTYPSFAGIENVTLTPQLPHAELASTFASHDVLVLPSHFESFGMVVAEAMACGLPAIVSTNVGAKQLIEPEQNGLIIEAGCADALFAGMAWFVRNLDHFDAMSACAVQAAAAYSWDAYRRRVLNFFSERLGAASSV